jgi:hypothetical protein
MKLSNSYPIHSNGLYIIELWQLISTKEDDDMALNLTPKDIKQIGEMWGKNLFNHGELEELFSTLPVEKRLKSLKLEERFIGLKPEERLAGLSPSERKELEKKLREAI